MVIIDSIMGKVEKELKTKHVGKDLINVIRNELFPMAFYQSNLEGQITVLEKENNKLKQQVEVLNGLNASSNVESIEALRQSRLEGQIDILKEENERLRQDLAISMSPDARYRIEELKKEVEKLKEENEKLRITESKPTAPTYAAIVGGNKSNTQYKVEQIKEKQATTLFYRSTNRQDTKTVRDVITKNINPRVDKVKIKSIRTTPSVVIVETETQDDCKKLMDKAPNLQDIICEGPRKRRPLLAVYSVPTTLSDEDFLGELYDLNLSEHLNEEDFQEEVKLRFKTGPKGKDRQNFIIEVSPRVRNLLLRQERTYISFHALKTADYTNVAKCYNCCDLGHPTKFCPETDSVCINCGQKGHKKKDCQNERKIGCIPCKIRGRECEKAGGTDCATYKILYARQIQKIDFGSD